MSTEPTAQVFSNLPKTAYWLTIQDGKQRTVAFEVEKVDESMTLVDPASVPIDFFIELQNLHIGEVDSLLDRYLVRIHVPKEVEND